MNVPRQNGKGEVLVARELFGLFELGERKVIHTAHEFKTSAEHFLRVESVIEECEELHSQVERRGTGRVVGFRHAHGDESIRLQDGRRMEFKTRTKSGMRGFSNVHLLVLDEAMIISEFAALERRCRSSAPRTRRAARSSGTRARPSTRRSHEHGVVWARVRERGHRRRGPGARLLRVVARLRAPRRRAGRGGRRSRVLAAGQLRDRARAHRSRSTCPGSAARWRDRGFEVELLGVGDWPATDGSADVLISQEEWADARGPRRRCSSIRSCIAFDVSPERHSSIVAAGRNDQRAR